MRIDHLSDHSVTEYIDRIFNLVRIDEVKNQKPKPQSDEAPATLAAGDEALTDIEEVAGSKNVDGPESHVDSDQLSV